MLTVNYKEAAELIQNSDKIAFIGNGGNLAIAQHAASDMYRHTGKFCFAPDSVHLSALGGDADWKLPWVEYAAQVADLVIGITTRNNSPITKALEEIDIGIPTLLVSPEKHESITTLHIPCETYHEFEVNALWTFYMIMEYNGVKLPTI